MKTVLSVIGFTMQATCVAGTGSPYGCHADW